MDATTMTTLHIDEYIADIGNFPPRSQLERQEERGGFFIIIFSIISFLDITFRYI